MKYKLKRSNVSQWINNKFLTSQTYVSLTTVCSAVHSIVVLFWLHIDSSFAMNNKKVNLHQANRRHLINLQYFVYFGKEGICVTLFTIRVCYMTRFCSIIICPYRAFWITHVFLFHVYIACIICHISLCVTGTFNLLRCNLLSIT